MNALNYFVFLAIRIFKNKIVKHLLLLMIWVSVVGSSWFYSVLVRNDLPGSITKGINFYTINWIIFKFISTSFLSLANTFLLLYMLSPVHFLRLLFDYLFFHLIQIVQPIEVEELEDPLDLQILLMELIV